MVAPREAWCEAAYRDSVTLQYRPPGHRRAARPAVVAVVLVALFVGLVPGVAHASDPARDQQWALDVIGADAAHAVGQGPGVTIAIVDSGVDLDHEDLTDNLVAGIDLVDPDTPPQDEFGHGTHVAGIAAAVGGNGRGIRGVAPRARIMPVRVLDEDGRGSSSDVSQGVRWAADNGADVVNLSLGEAGQQVFGSSLVDAIEYAWGRGVVVVVAAGNEFVLGSGFSDEPALVVSATTRDDHEPDYSNGVGNARWGMAAPGGGCQLLTCPREDGVFSTYWEADRPDVYAYLSGTSMAAPHVAGAAAVLRSLGLSPRETVDRLLATAEDLGPSGRDSTYGAGRLDLAAATAGLGPGAEETQPDAERAPGSDARPRPTGPSPSEPAEPSPPPAGSPGRSSPTAATPSPEASQPSAPPGADGSAASATPDPTPADPRTPAASAAPTALADAAGSPGNGPVGVLAAILLVAAVAGVGGVLWARARGQW